MRYGFGSIYQRKRDGLWCAAVQLATERGERRRKVFTSVDRNVAVAKLLEYREANPAKVYRGRDAYLAEARERGTHTEADWWALVREVNGRCFYCGVETIPYQHASDNPLATQRDHLVPLSRGGSDALDNVVVSCRSCNAEKATMTASEYLNWKAVQRA